LKSRFVPNILPDPKEYQKSSQNHRFGDLESVFAEANRSIWFSWQQAICHKLGLPYEFSLQSFFETRSARILVRAGYARSGDYI
jgi:hypothetical protein